MKPVVVDASVATKWYVPEAHAAAAFRLLDSEFILYAPDLLRTELANVLWKKVRRQEITPEEAMEILTAFASLPIEIYPSDVLIVPALEIAVALNRTVYDSLYLALAVAVNGVLITADRGFCDAVMASPLTRHVRWVEDDV